MKKILIILCTLLITFIQANDLSDPFSKAELEYIKNKKIVKVCVEKGAEPFVITENKVYKGITIDYLNHISKKTNLNFEIVLADTVAEDFNMTKSGICDMTALIISDQNVLNFVTATSSYISDNIVLLTKIDEPYLVDLNNLPNKKIGISKGAKDLAAYIKSIYPNINLVEVDELNFSRVISGEVYGYIGPSYYFAYKIAMDYPNELKIMSKVGVEKLNASFGIRNNEPILLSLFNKSLDAIPSIEERKIANSWLSIQVEKQFDYTLLWQVIGVFCIIFIIIMFSYIKQRKLKRELESLNENLEDKVLEKTEDLNDQKNELEALVSSYDKNVIYSSTNLAGYITDVSDAFCRVSGYTREELIGQNHNIVRHPDMPASKFEELWKLLVQEKSFESEVKNLKKDGGYFWIKSFFAPEYDKQGNHIGYTAVRDNITDRKEVEDLQSEIEETQKEVIFKMGSIGESRSRETGYHIKRVAEYSKLLALYYGLSEEDAELLKQASPMHDIGKVAIPDDILNKPAKLTENEMLIMKTHSQLGFDMLHGSTRPLLNTAAIVAHEHHEKWDGSGYPQGLTALEIHVYGRITALADVFDALGSDRCYKKAWCDEDIFAFFKEQSGKHFEPKLVDIFFDNLDEFLVIRDKLVDK